jgi:hypothetical protein
MGAFAAVVLWVYLDSSYCLIRNCALVHAAGWVPMVESSCAWTKTGRHKAKTPQLLSSMRVFAAVALRVYPSSSMVQPSTNEWGSTNTSKHAGNPNMFPAHLP